MATIRVYRYWGYDVKTAERALRPLMATRETIAHLINCALEEGSGVEIDDSQLDGNGLWTPPE